MTALERLVLKSLLLQRIVVDVHTRALSSVLAAVPGPVESIGIVGGGLFPRTALALRRLRPESRLTIIDGCDEHLEIARRMLDSTQIEFRSCWFSPGQPHAFDLIVIPLSYAGDRARLYRHPPARAVIVHDWIWHKRGTTSRVVALPLLKRLNLVCQ